MKALIIIDMLEGYAQQVYNREEVVANQLALIGAFRTRGFPIVIVSADLSAPNPVMVRLWGVEFADEPEKARLIGELENVEGATYFSKAEYSAFFRTPLESFCEEHGIDELFFCGYASGVCVFFSAVDAAMRRILPVLVSDASTTNERSWHEKTCERFEEVLGPVMDTQQILVDLDNPKG